MSQPEALDQVLQSKLELLVSELLEQPTDDHAAPARQMPELVDFEAYLWVLSHHPDLQTFTGVTDDGGSIVDVRERDDIRVPSRMTADSADYLVAKNSLHLFGAELDTARASTAELERGTALARLVQQEGEP